MGFGDLFGMFRDVIGAAEDLGVADAISAAVTGGGEPSAGRGESATATYDRVLTGGKRNLGVNDR